ncbi:MAG: hypothetical protein OD814_001828 [Candidatus Alkanophagales archaeon MCA70_species_1]|nr:hypothetical protein [Candidatus Alkanophaga volatiphilum]
MLFELPDKITLQGRNQTKVGLKAGRIYPLHPHLGGRNQTKVGLKEESVMPSGMLLRKKSDQGGIKSSLRMAKTLSSA